MVKTLNHSALKGVSLAKDKDKWKAIKMQGDRSYNKGSAVQTAVEYMRS